MCRVHQLKQCSAKYLFWVTNSLVTLTANEARRLWLGGGLQEFEKVANRSWVLLYFNADAPMNAIPDTVRCLTRPPTVPLEPPKLLIEACIGAHGLALCSGAFLLLIALAICHG